MTARLRRLTERDWDALDRILAGVLFLAMVVDLTRRHHQHDLVAALLSAAVVAGALLWRRRNPLLMATVTLAGIGVILVSFTHPSQAFSVVVVVIVASYSLGAHLDLRRSLVGLAMIVAAITTVCAIDSPNDIFFPLVFFGIVPWTVGRAFRTQTALARELTEKADREQIAREEEEARAAMVERARVARELHDVLAHNLSVMVIQASAARRVADLDPAAALQAAEVISRTGREALSELRYVFGPVRRETGDELGAAPGLGNLAQLASRAHRAGLPVEIRLEGQPRQLAPGADLAAYRVVQQALTNALKHAQGARATVTVRYRPADVMIEVLDSGARSGANGNAPDGGGHGLVGMRERLALYGGKLEAGRRSEGGFAVRAQLPLGGPTA
ncbi:MAG TPA: histidine kinase [Solirubrobacteraceae bacterium]|nr:histidine kinase [Solirubrobacteraceae bacterium]